MWNKPKTRRGGIKYKSKRTTKFTLLGNNTAGLKAKRDSLEAIISTFKNPGNKIGEKYKFSAPKLSSFPEKQE